MDYFQFLNKIIADGIKAARRDYAERPEMQQGAIAGFKACRGKNPPELARLLRKVSLPAAFVVARNDKNLYWTARCRQAEIEWVCNCVSVILVDKGLAPIILPTARGVLRAADVLWLRGDSNEIQN